MTAVAPGCAEIPAAAARLAGLVHATPVLGSAFFARESGAAAVVCKCENLQKVGAFKARGALNAVLRLPETAAARGVLTHSSGNHGQALAWAAARRGARAYVVMPEGSPEVKVAAVRGYGAQISFCAPTTAAREVAAAAVAARTGAVLVHPYDHADVIAGQGTAAWELLRARPDLDALIVPVGGGGLAAGTCLAAQAAGGAVAVYGVEPEGADDTARSLAAGRRVARPAIETVADGLRAAMPGELTFPILQTGLKAVLTVTDAQIVAAMRLGWERLKLVIEPSSATVLAALLVHKSLWAGRRIGVILSGGNVDLTRPLW